jgi:hypothetical protein
LLGLGLEQPCRRRRPAGPGAPRTAVLLLLLRMRGLLRRLRTLGLSFFHFHVFTLTLV